MQAERHQERVQHWDQDGEHKRRVTVQPRKANTNPCAERVAERPNHDRGDWDHHQEGEERHEHHVDRGRNNLLETLVHQGRHDRHDQRHEHVAAVVRQQHRQAHHRHAADLGAEQVIRLNHGIRVARQPHELRGEQRQDDSGRHPRLNVELLARVVRNHHRQEVEHRAPHRVDELPTRRLDLRMEVRKFEGVHHCSKRNN